MSEQLQELTERNEELQDLIAIWLVYKRRVPSALIQRTYAVLEKKTSYWLGN